MGDARDNPSLKSILADAIMEAYRVARLEAETETGLSRETFPTACPWSFEEAMDPELWPDQAH